MAGCFGWFHDPGWEAPPPGVAALRQQHVHPARLEVTSDHHRGDPGQQQPALSVRRMAAMYSGVGTNSTLGAQQQVPALNVGLQNIGPYTAGRPHTS